MNNEIKRFYEYIIENTDIQENLKENLKNINTQKELENFIELEIMPLAKENNFNFTLNDLINYEKESLQRLTSEDLLNIAGGTSPKSLILSGGLFSLILLGSGTISGTTAHATLPTEVVKNSFEKHLKNIDYSLNSSEEKSIILEQTSKPKQIQEASPELTLETKQTQEALPELALETKQTQEASPELTLETKQAQEVSPELTLETKQAQEVSPELTLETKQTQEASLEPLVENSQGQISAVKQMEKETVFKSTEKMLADNAIQQNKNNNQVDIPYIVNALNLLDPYVYNITGVTEKFRFFDVYKTQITVGKPLGDNIPGWEFNKDEGIGSPNFMRCLFPSSAGVLNSENGNPNIPSFSKDCKPTPEMIANFTGYLYKYVRCEDENIVNAANKELDNTINILNDLDKNKEKINDINNFFNNRLGYKLNGDFSNNIKKLKTYLYLLKNATCMIQEQELLYDEETEERVLPKYTTEKMLMCYFIQHFNHEEEVNQFYNRVKKIILTNNKQVNLNLENSLNRLETLKIILDKISNTPNCPYTNILVSNGSTQVIKLNKKNKLIFTSDIFADCAETVIRQIINLLSYNDKTKWSFILDENNNAQKELEINNILNAINKNNEVDKKTLKERLILFFYYQKTRGGADISSQEARTFWNYVISHMNKESTEYVYKIRYSHKNNELDTGWINCLKLTYNILHSLKADDPSFQKKLTDAKSKIDTLDKNFTNKENNFVLNNSLQEAIKYTLGIITNVSIDEPYEILVPSYNKNQDIFATVNISKCDEDNNVLFKFPISQMMGHASIEYAPYDIKELNENEENLKLFLEKDYVAQLLTRKFNIECIAKYSFNYYYGSGISKKEQQDIFLFNNYYALSFLKSVQGEGNNSPQIEYLLETCYISAVSYNSINILHSSKNNKYTFSNFIYDNYINSKETISTFFFLGDDLSTIDINFMKDGNNINEIYDISENNNRILCKIKPDKTAALLFLENDNEIIIPKEISINQNTYVVSEILGTANNNLTHVSFQDDIKKLIISDGAFANCKGLKSFSIPKSVTSLLIGKYAFYNCTELETFNILANINALTIDNEAFSSCKSLKNFIIPSSVTSLSIGYSTFNNCKKFTEFIVPNSVTSLSIGIKAFENCENFEKFSFFDGINLQYLFIGNQAFYNCKELAEFNVPNHINDIFIDENAFNENTQIHMQ